MLSLRSRDDVLAAFSRGENRRAREAAQRVRPRVIEAAIRVAFAVTIGATLGFQVWGHSRDPAEWGLLIACPARTTDPLGLPTVAL